VQWNCRPLSSAARCPFPQPPLATLSEAEQVEIVARGEKEILAAAKTIRAKRVEKSHAERMERIREISAGNGDLPGGKYAIVYADPPWHFEAYNEASGMERSAGMHYPCMSTADIRAMPVADLATDDAVLFMWATSSHLADAVDIIRAWGFTLKTNAVWIKPSIGLGYLLRNRHELMLIATRGDIPAPLPANRPDSVIEAPRGDHSRKPDEAYALVERMYPTLPKIELFARQARPGWDAWGNEIDKYDTAADVEGSFAEAYAAIRERKAKGGPGWNPKEVSSGDRR
jgi:N6-adenosine-specific RNA methylase IME4